METFPLLSMPQADAMPPANGSVRKSSNGAVVAWLTVVYLMVLAIVVVGGTTRLTGSGLSMVEWRPLMGTLPPNSDQAWNHVFSQYRLSPQFQLVNHWMDLAAFKRIFFWEYLHRLLGRLVGAVLILPGLYFWLKKRLPSRTTTFALGALVLGGCQGLLGWYMVRSGLSEIPEVSHFRLAAHLLLALVVSQWVLWMILDLSAPWKDNHTPIACGPALALLVLGFLYVQIAYGAFVAGKRAGLLSTTFPDMNGYYLPTVFFTEDTPLENLLHNPAILHYAHRALALALLFLLTGAGVYVWRTATVRHDRALGQSLIALVLVQFTLGALTVLSEVAIPWAVIHQLGAFCLVGLATAFLHRNRRWRGTSIVSVHG